MGTNLACPETCLSTARFHHGLHTRSITLSPFCTFLADRIYLFNQNAVRKNIEIYSIQVYLVLKTFVWCFHYEILQPINVTLLSILFIAAGNNNALIKKEFCARCFRMHFAKWREICALRAQPIRNLEKWSRSMKCGMQVNPNVSYEIIRFVMQ